MRWMMIALLVSLVGLLLAAAGVARHIWRHRSQLRGRPGPGTGPGPATNAASGAVFDPVEEVDQEL
jgi:hypothetical protein